MTNRAFREYVKAANPPRIENSVWGKAQPLADDQLDWPVTNVTFRQASEFAAWHGRRLATEAELEVAGRGPKTDRLWPPGIEPGTVLDGPVWLELHPVRANPLDRIQVGTGGDLWGLYGNAGELTLYGFRPYPGNRDQRVSLDFSPIAARWTGRVVRCGLIEDYTEDFRQVVLGYHLRGSQPPEEASAFVGFRCARSAEPLVGWSNLPAVPVEENP